MNLELLKEVAQQYAELCGYDNLQRMCSHPVEAENSLPHRLHDALRQHPRPSGQYPSDEEIIRQLHSLHMHRGNLRTAIEDGAQVDHLRHDTHALVMWACDWAAVRQRERDAQTCEAERVEEETGATEDVAYNLAIEHCAEAIRSQGHSVDTTKMVAQPAPAQAERPLIARALAEWHEDDGPVSWWAWCGHEWAGEPAWIGTPLDDDWPGYHTHWTPHPAMPVCSDCPPDAYPTDKTRCELCPRRTQPTREAKQQWISCAVRKPKERGRYLVLHADSDEPQICNYGTSRGWGNGRYNRQDNPYRVTHWMPLPSGRPTREGETP